MYRHKVSIPVSYTHLMCGKLALHFKKKGKSPLLVACDIHRPAAIKQLEVVGGQAGVPVFQMGQENPAHIFLAAREAAMRGGNDLMIVDTAGRLHIDSELMEELKELRQAAQPVSYTHLDGEGVDDHLYHFSFGAVVPSRCV